MLNKKVLIGLGVIVLGVLAYRHYHKPTVVVVVPPVVPTSKAPIVAG